MLVWPLIHWISSISPISPSEQFYEWFIFFTILSWILPLMLLLLRKLIKTTKMTQQKSDLPLKRRIYSKLTNTNLVKYSIIIGIPFFLLILIISYIIAQFDLPGYNFSPYAKDLTILVPDPLGYNIFNDVISNLGSYRYSPIPQIFNFGIMISSILFIPSVFYIHKLLLSTKNNSEKNNLKEKLKRYLIKLSTIGLLTGIMSLFGVGFFSKDVAKYIRNLYGPVFLNFGWHIISATIFTVSIMLVSIFMGFLFIFYNSSIVKIFNSKIKSYVYYCLGFEMLIAIPVVLGIMAYLLESFWEWVFFILVFGWLIPFLLMLLIPLNSINSNYHSDL